MRWRKRKTLPIRPWYDVDDEDLDLARSLLNERLETADRERRALHRDWFGLLSRIQARLQQEDRVSDLPAAIDEELDRLDECTGEHDLRRSLEKGTPHVGRRIHREQLDVRTGSTALRETPHPSPRRRVITIISADVGATFIC
jgi:hypothetical protein